jgi:hypothetical protein
MDLSLSALADQVGAGTTALQPLHALIERHILAAERQHIAMTTMVDPSRGGPRRPHSITPRATTGRVSIRRTPQSLSQESLARRRTGDACGPTLGLENGAGWRSGSYSCWRSMRAGASAISPSNITSPRDPPAEHVPVREATTAEPLASAAPKFCGQSDRSVTTCPQWRRALTSQFYDSQKNRTQTRTCNGGTNLPVCVVRTHKKCEVSAQVACRSNSGTVAGIDREGIRPPLAACLGRVRSAVCSRVAHVPSTKLLLLQKRLREVQPILRDSA